jgi:hypothetical protein
MACDEEAYTELRDIVTVAITRYSYKIIGKVFLKKRSADCNETILALPI